MASRRTCSTSPWECRARQPESRTSICAGTAPALSGAEIKRRIPEIVEFADLGSVIHDPVRTYSSGMQLRLAFAVATSVKPEILLARRVDQRRRPVLCGALKATPPKPHRCERESWCLQVIARRCCGRAVQPRSRAEARQDCSLRRLRGRCPRILRIRHLSEGDECLALRPAVTVRRASDEGGSNGETGHHRIR